MAEKPIEIPVKISGIKSIKTELLDLKLAIASSTDPKEMEKLAKRAGELTDSIRDANEQINIFAGGSGFERVNTNLGDISGKLMSLDFAGAGDSAKILAQNISQINPAEVTEQMEGLVTTFAQLGKAGGMAIGGLIKNVGAMAKAFFSFGVGLLANPIFLITTAIVALVAIIGVIMNKLGLLKPILDGIGFVFGLIMKAIDKVVQSFKDLADWLGLTDFAGEELAKNEAKRVDKMASDRREAHNGIIRGLDEEIKIRRAQGKDVTALELEKQKAILKTAQIEFDANNTKINNAKFLKTLSDEEIKTLRKNYKESKEIVLQAKSDLKVFQAEQEANAKAKEAEQASKGRENAKASADRAKQFAKDRLDAQRTAKDLELSLLDDGFMKERAKLDEQTKRQIEDIKNNSKLLATEKANQIKLLNEQLAIEDKKIVDAELLRLQEEEDQIANEKEAQRLREIEQAKVQAENLVKIEEDKAKILQEQYEKDKLAYQATQEAKRQTTQAVFDGIAQLGSIFIKDQKKLEKLNKASALVQIGIDTAKAISALVANASANPLNAVTFGSAGLAQYATGIVQILTNVAKAKAILSGGSASAGASGGGGGASSSSATTQTPTQSATPQVNLFGGANQFNNVGGAQSVQGGTMIRAVVSETEITNSQTRVNRFEQLATL